MASSVLSSTAIASRATAAQASMVAPFTGLKSTASFPVTRKSADFTSIATNGTRVQCMQVWPPYGKKKFETLSYLPTMSTEQLLNQVEYLLNNGWVPCLEFETEFTGILRRKILDDVEAADVRVHGCDPSGGGAGRVQKGIPGFMG
nr:Ribulose bisphosphate carboxylase small chain, chloroplastic [Ipomoea batatas]